jgi:hypothetical protein
MGGGTAENLLASLHRARLIAVDGDGDVREGQLDGVTVDGVAPDITAYLRHAAAHRPEDQELHALIGELSVHSEDFVRIWSEHPVSDCLPSRREYRNPRVGSMTLNEEVVRLTDDPGVRIIFSGAQEGTPSAERLRLLATLG